MLKPSPRRGRPRLSPEDNETRERILDTAQRLFAERGFSKVSVRELTSAAGVNLATVNYYFGSKDKLLLALVKRAARAINRERARLLAEAKQAGGTREERLRKLLFALLSPTIPNVTPQGSENLYSSLMARTAADAPEELGGLVERQTSHLNPFAEELRALLPEVPAEEIYWRLHFILNIEHAVHTELGRVHHLSKGVCNTADREAILQRMINFGVAGLCAGPRPGPSARKRRARKPGSRRGRP